MEGQYSYHCKKCGYTFISNDKKKVAKARKNHRPIERVTFPDMGDRFLRKCPMVATDKTGAMIARPDLAYRIQSSNKK